MANFAYKNFELLNAVYNAMKAEGLDWRMEAKQRPDIVWSHVLLRNCTDTERDIHLFIYINENTNIIYPVIWVNGTEKFEDIRNRLMDQENVTELSDAEYTEISPAEFAKKEHGVINLYKVNSVYKVVNPGSTKDWMSAVITQVKEVLKVVKNFVF